MMMVMPMLMTMMMMMVVMMKMVVMPGQGTPGAANSCYRARI